MHSSVLIMFKHFCIAFTSFMMKGKYLLDYTNLFLVEKTKRTIEIILKYFQKLKT